jgi:CheY-like chemotaxis protein/HPt (histidine-containing phosphotransfer) domain-containing protein
MGDIPLGWPGMLPVYERRYASARIAAAWAPGKGRERACSRAESGIDVSMKPSRNSPRRIRKSFHAVEEFLDRLDENGAGSAAVNVRRSDRYRYRVQSLEVELQQAGAGWTHYEVPSRNLSREGAAFLLGHFVYPGTLCRVHLVGLQGQHQVVNARVVRCRYIEGSGSLHEVGVSFEHVVDVAMFNRWAARLRFLLVDDDASMHRLIAHWLKSLDVELTCVENGRKAVEMVGASSFDLILLAMELPDSPGIDTARRLRQKGFARTIVALSATGRDDHESECLAAGCNRYLSKPISRDNLVELVESLKETPIFSSMADDESFTDLIDAFVVELPEKVGRLEGAFSRNDVQALTNIVRILKGEGGAYGFQAITDTAAQVEQALQDQVEMREIRKQLNELIHICLSTRSTRRNQWAGAAWREGR